MKRDVNVALVGYAFMGKAHANGYRKLAYMAWPPPLQPRLVSLAGRNLFLTDSALREGALRDATEREARSREITAEVLRLEKLVVDMETGLRGLTLTGENRFLEPYTQARRELPDRLGTLQSLVADDPAQRRRAAAGSPPRTRSSACCR